MKDLSGLEKLQAYRLIEKRRLEELKSTGVIMEHKKTGARVFLISNDDENKVFNIGFRTPPADSTGVAHILEHSVLCGSEKFPVKDPFVELVKGSLNTFLNAMTYPDKTVYPVASCNQKDFQNLMDVYLDAVFHPNIYREPKIFMQEGWHYELESTDGPLTYNGVVYNEMKGAFSSPESVLDRAARQVLFPHTCYGHESGGDPADIPQLTYEEFLKFHEIYYHPSNCYLYLYGDMDMAEKLDWIDREYFSHYEKKEVDSRILMEEPFSEPVEKEIFYSITEEESDRDAAYLSLNTVVDTDLDPRLYVAFQILEYTLIDAPGAPLKQALLDAGIGQDVLGGYENGILQPYFSVIAKNANKEQRGEFLAVVRGTLRKLADRGLNRKSLLAGMNYYEFKYREADYGSAPKGLMYGLQCMDSWLYDGDPMMHLQYQETFDFLKQAVEEGYFEELIRKYLLDNPFEAVLILSPSKGLTAREDARLEEKLAACKASLSGEELKELVEQTRALKEFQDAPSPQEELKKIPLLQRSDIRREAEHLIWEEKQIGGIKVIHHEMFTSGIGYLKVLFSTDRVPQEYLPYVGLLKSVLGYVNTEHYTYGELTSEIHLNSGGVSLSVSSYPDLQDPSHVTGMFTASVRVLYDKLDFGCRILNEILTASILDDEKRLGEIIGETRSRARMKLDGAGHSAAVSRATSYFSPTAYFNELTGGIACYHFLEDLAAHYEERKEELIRKLKETCEFLFNRENMMISYTADREGLERLEPALPLLLEGLKEGTGRIYPLTFEAGNRNEGFQTSSQVNYVARCGTYFGSGFAYTGALRILKVILSYDYLWINVRVKGGAYGCMSGFGRSGEGYLVSYRDPNLAKTNEIYEKVVEYLEQFSVEERDMTKYVIGTISDLDAPMMPAARGARGLSAYLSGVTDEMMQKERDEILDAGAEDIRRLAGIVRAVLETGSFCVIGNEDRISADQEMFGEIRHLYQ